MYNEFEYKLARYFASFSMTLKVNGVEEACSSTRQTNVEHLCLVTLSIIESTIKILQQQLLSLGLINFPIALRKKELFQTFFSF